jgi:hypothetical protein
VSKPESEEDGFRGQRVIKPLSQQTYYSDADHAPTVEIESEPYSLLRPSLAASCSHFADQFKSKGEDQEVAVSGRCGPRNHFLV